MKKLLLVSLVVLFFMGCGNKYPVEEALDIGNIIYQDMTILDDVLTENTYFFTTYSEIQKTNKNISEEGKLTSKDVSRIFKNVVEDMESGSEFKLNNLQNTIDNNEYIITELKNRSKDLKTRIENLPEAKGDYMVVKVAIDALYKNYNDFLEASTSTESSSDITSFTQNYMLKKTMIENVLYLGLVNGAVGVSDKSDVTSKQPFMAAMENVEKIKQKIENN